MQAHNLVGVFIHTPVLFYTAEKSMSKEPQKLVLLHHARFLVDEPNAPHRTNAHPFAAELNCAKVGLPQYSERLMPLLLCSITMRACAESKKTEFRFR